MKKKTFDAREYENAIRPAPALADDSPNYPIF